MKVLIVDDSVVYRSKIRAALSSEPWIEVVGAASNGKIALEMMGQKNVDLVTLDMEMPVMGGIETLKQMRSLGLSTKVIMFSSQTRSGSEMTLDALLCGANDFVAKPAGSASSDETAEDLIRAQLIPKIKQFQELTAPSSAPKLEQKPKVQAEIQPTYLKKHLDTFNPSIIVIASSTGGPAAHDELFRELKGTLKCPLLIAQHMPPIFTTSFARRIASYHGLPCKEAVDGEALKNEIYVAPGNYHLSLKRVNGQLITHLHQNPPRNSVRPAADYLFESAAELCGDKCMAFVLTGMGEDGLSGALAVKKVKGGVMIQNRETCVVFGMPGAVHAAKLQDGEGSLLEIRKMIQRMAFK